MEEGVVEAAGDAGGDEGAEAFDGFVADEHDAVVGGGER